MTYETMKNIVNKEFGGERPLYCEKDLLLEGVVIHAGESALKETANVVAKGCRFEGKYPLWICEHSLVRNCHFTEGARAGAWYSRDMVIEDCLYEAPKGFREMESLKLRRVRMPNALETLWSCRKVDIEDFDAQKADYIFMRCDGVKLRNARIDGNYMFQWTRNAVVSGCVLNTRDAFWETDNVSVYDSIINGEFLGWHSRNLKLVRCHINGTQPLCYAENLVLEDCTFGEESSLAFEYSTVEATIRGAICSVKNPRSGFIRAERIGEIILDSNIKDPGNCAIENFDFKRLN